MKSEVVFSRTVATWRLVFVHMGQLLHFLTRALLLSMASIGVTFGLLCCWLDRFRSEKGTDWIIPMKAKAAPPLVEERLQPVAVAAPRRRQPRAAERIMPHQKPHQPRTIDSMIRSKGMHV